MYHYRRVSDKGSVSSIWIIVPKRSRVSDCSKLQIKGPFILLHKCSRYTVCCRTWHVMRGVVCARMCVCVCCRAAGSVAFLHYLFITEWGEWKNGEKQLRCQTHVKGRNQRGSELYMHLLPWLNPKMLIDLKRLYKLMYTHLKGFLAAGEQIT